MFQFTSFVLFIVLSLINEISADWCYDDQYQRYYCSMGQSCGSYYGDCRGLPTYIIISIVSSSLLLLSVCIRCCIYMNNNNRQPVPRRVVQRTARNQSYLPTRAPTTAPLHNIQEGAPPSYNVATSPTTELTKY